MPTRNDMLIALYREVIGPRNGPNEILPEEQDPRTEYITGVLEPVTASSTDERIEDNIDEIIEETSSEEDQDSQGYVASPGVFAPALDPKALPRSIGVSFTLEAEDGIPQIEVCATWSRYYLEQDGWHRNPSGYLSGSLDVSQASIDLTAGAGARLHIRSRQLIPGVWKVSIFLINVTQIVGEHPTTSEYLFQPQLRTHILNGTKLVPVRHLDDNHTQSHAQPFDNQQEELSLALLYRQRTAFARGHMCGAMWKEIDPERPFELTNRPQEAPFVWTDSETITESERGKYSPADVRSELIPIYLIQTPDMDWLNEYGRPPELRPEVLAETWDPDQVRAALQPLVEGYQAWLQVQQSELNRLEAVYQDVARTHLQECNQVASRIQEAIEILCSDEDARLAFCFANKAIDMQARWKNLQRSLAWRPFQLAFILLNIPSLANPFHPDRDICDLLWFPTGGGKTEAYLGLSAFVLGLRRLRAKHDSPGQDRTGAGVGVLSRYTLRLLTIQQFRRALGVVTACETLRMMGAGRGSTIGWRPHGCQKTDNLIWGGIRFSAGLWVGGGVTPNSMMSIGPMPVPGGTGFMMIAGALDILRGLRPDYDGPDAELARYVQQVRRNLQVEGEPAQVTNCPCCQTPLAISDEGLGAGEFTLHFVYQGGNPTIPPISMLTPRRPIPSLVINSVNIFSHQSPTYRTISINFTIPDGSFFSSLNVDDWWEQSIKPALGGNAQIQSARPSRPGYFILKYSTNQGSYKQNDFDIFCPNPNCDLNQSLWAEQVPEPREREGSRTNVRRQVSTTPNPNRIPDPVIDLTDGLLWQDIPEPFRLEQGKKWSTRIPIPAFTVDDQIYHRCPSLVISTVDKFARLAFEPKAASLFGNVTHYHSRWGYYRIWCPPSDGSQQTGLRDHPAGRAVGNPLHRGVPPFSPPELILQDELHLIEGPLGSMVGLFETAVDMLSQRIIDERFVFPKYIASTATVRQAEAQVKSLFNRRLTQFPPSAVSSDERFFATGTEAHPLDTRKPGRLYAAVCAPGKGAQTPIVRIWSSLLQGSFDLSQSTSINEIDPFWTLVGYFNATRELAGALSLYRQDIPERMESRSGMGARVLDESRRLELSSRASSMNLPVLLQKLEISMPNAQDAVFATSMFGTGVDVDRLSLMVVHGQPKTTSSYIQATGRVGRKTSALVVSFFRASRPRDLDHYEFFTGYHRALYRYVEPVTVAPFSPRARERSLGPLAVVLLRQAKALNGIRVHEQWRIQQRIGSTFHSLANRMASARFDPEVMIIPELFEQRSIIQPVGRRPVPGITNNETASELDRWRAIAALYPNPDQFVYNEPAVLRQPQRHVVLGDAQHRGRLEEAFENAPQSLRDVEETTGFKV
ncbi:MAG: helicase [Chloroflexota bacterium]|nr:helicase [Chloroflexota bacterium]WKZ36248.1 MAG: DISARM system helicase DrmA [Anaerolineales bacterium]